MATGRIIQRLGLWLTAVCIFVAQAMPASASTILVREELGLSFVPSGLEWLLQENGPSVIYDLSAASPGAIWELHFANGSFLMTALANNNISLDFSAFGLDVYPGGVTPVTPAFDCSLTTPCYNGWGFFAWLSFPDMAGETLSLAVPPLASVAEPGTLTLLALALLGLVCAKARSVPINHRAVTARRRTQKTLTLAVAKP